MFSSRTMELCQVFYDAQDAETKKIIIITGVSKLLVDGIQKHPELESLAEFIFKDELNKKNTL